MVKIVSRFGITLSNAKRRLDAIPNPRDQKKDPEHIMARLWAKENTRDSEVNFDGVPLDHILHECGPKCDPQKGHHSYSEPNEHDVRVASATVQWLATNCGRGFLHEFFRALKEANKI